MIVPQHTSSLQKYQVEIPNNGPGTNNHLTSTTGTTIDPFLHDKPSSNSHSRTTTPNTSTIRNLPQPSHRCLRLEQRKPLHPPNHKGHLPTIAKELMNKNRKLKKILRKIENEIFIFTQLYSHLLVNNK